MTKIEGTITFEDNTTVTAPGAVTPQGSNPGGTTPAANPFANTKWRTEIETTENGQTITFVGILSFGTDTWTLERSLNGQLERGFSGIYTVSGNTATLTSSDGVDTGTATISGNVLTVYGMADIPIPFTKVN
jgi:hypothetical protein